MSAVRRPVSIPVLWVCFILSILSFSSCVDKIKTDIVVYKAADEGLINSNNVINYQNEATLTALEDATRDPKSREKAVIWFPKAQLIHKLSNEIDSYIDGLRSDLKKEAGLKTNGNVESFKESDKNAVMRLFEKRGKSEELYDRLKNYKKDLLNIDSSLTAEFKGAIQLTTAAFDSSNEKQDFNKTFFDDVPTIAALTMLSKFQNNIRITEHKMIRFCHTSYSVIAIRYDTYIGFAAPSCNYVRAKQEMEITAGLGAFSKAVEPMIIIDKKNMSIEMDGLAHYKFRASDKPGKYNVPVEITYVNQEAVQHTISKTVEYTVAQ